MSHHPDILKTYNKNCDLLSFVNSILYFEENLSSLSTLSYPGFYTKKAKTNSGSYTVLVNRYIPSTYEKLNEYSKFFLENNIKSIVVIENTFQLSEDHLEGFKHMSGEEKDKIREFIK